MQSENYTQLLDLAARLWRIDPEYWDIWGRKHITSDETKRAILQGLGVRAETAESLRASIEARRRKEWTRLAPPCLVVTQNSAVELPLHAPADLGREAAHIEIREETGATHPLEFALGSYPECGATERAVSDEVDPASTGTVTAWATHEKRSSFSSSERALPSPVEPAMTSPSQPCSTRNLASWVATSKSIELSGPNGVTIAVRTVPKRGNAIF